MMYCIGWVYAFVILRLYVGVRVIGREHLPRRGAVIIAANHASNIDPFLIGTSFFRMIEYMAKEELFRTRFTRWLMQSWHAHPLRRSGNDFRALKTTIELLKQGKALLVFPEGTRSKDGEMQPAKPGVGFIALKSAAPVVPVYIHGSRAACSGEVRQTLRRHPVTVVIGRPLLFDAGFAERGKDAYQAASEHVMARIAALKEEYEGRAR